MRLNRLRLQNFRQHAATEIEFGLGLTGILGPNGAGKSTILEAIGWAIYGSAAARGTNETIPFNRAPPRSRVEVELSFELAGHQYRVVRTMYNAEVYLDDSPAPIATSLVGVTEYLTRRLAMRREEFFNTYFTGQKELQFLSQLGPTQRGRFLSEVLGYERLRIAQERARARRNELRHQIEGLRSALPDPKLLELEREAVESRWRGAQSALESAHGEHRAAAEALALLRPRWERLQIARDRDRELAHRLEVARREAELAGREIARLEAELEAVGRAEVELGPLREELVALPRVVRESKRLHELARIGARRRALEEGEEQLAKLIARGRRRLERLEEAPEYLERYRRELAAARDSLEAAESEVRSRLARWVETKREAETRLQLYRERAQRLREEIKALVEGGEEGPCPTCGRPLGKNLEEVRARLEDEWEAIVQDGKWLKQRRAQLESKPEDLLSAEEALTEAETEVEEANDRLVRCERAVRELTLVRRDLGRRERELERRRAELAHLPAGHDPERQRAVEARLEELRALERRANRLEAMVTRKGESEAALGETRARVERLEELIGELEAMRSEIGFADSEYEQLRTDYEGAVERARRAELRETELRAVLQGAEEARGKVIEAEARYREREESLRSLEKEFRYHDELDAALAQLRAELNARLRPELSQIASSFLTEITDSRYTSLEVDEEYDILVLDEGEEKPVISGGEEDIANLVIRLAVSQMIADRAGHPLSVLILDEVFGSLDLERRDNVIELLNRLSDRFEQVILITHIESIREGLDQVIQVEYDERSGTSIVTPL